MTSIGYASIPSKDGKIGAGDNAGDQSSNEDHSGSVIARGSIPEFANSFDAEFDALTSATEERAAQADEFDPRGRSLLALQRALKRRETRRGFRKMLNVRSRSEPLVQIADLVAGAILRAVAHGDTENLNRLQPQIRTLHYFQPEAKNPPS